MSALGPDGPIARIIDRLIRRRQIPVVAQQVTRTLHVDGGRTDSYEADGSPSLPFKTVQATVDYAEANMAPSYLNPVTIQIALQSGVYYDETVVIKKGGITLWGTGGGWPGGVAIKRVIITNATAASLATFVANGGLTDPATNYGDLVADSYHPEGCSLRNINLGHLDTYTDNALMCLGVGNLNSTLSFQGLECDSVEVFGTSYFRTVTYLWFYNASWFNDTVTTYNIRNIAVDSGGGQAYVGDRDSLDDLPVNTDNVGLLTYDLVASWQSITLNGEAAVGGGNSGDINVIGNVVLNDTSSMYLRGGFINGNLTVAGDSSINLKGTHVQGNVTLDNTGGAVACTYDGGRYMGTLTDAGGRLTRNVGN